MVAESHPIGWLGQAENFPACVVSKISAGTIKLACELGVSSKLNNDCTIVATCSQTNSSLELILKQSEDYEIISSCVFRTFGK